MSERSYRDSTYDSLNPLTRFAHRSRFKKGVTSIEPRDGLRLLDYGCGDGLFLNRLLESTPMRVELLGFEPFMDSLGGNEIPIVRDWSAVESLANDDNKFDYVTCFEVLEHFNAELQEAVLRKILSVLSPTGHLIVSVPIEVGLPSVVKNVIRRLANNDDRGTYTATNILRSFCGRSIPEFREQSGYLSHMGFYFRDLEKILLDFFIIEKRSYSPIGYLGSALNSQVFYTMKIRRPDEIRPM